MVHVVNCQNSLIMYKWRVAVYWYWICIMVIDQRKTDRWIDRVQWKREKERVLTACTCVNMGSWENIFTNVINHLTKLCRLGNVLILSISLSSFIPKNATHIWQGDKDSALNWYIVWSRLIFLFGKVADSSVI